MSYVRLLRLPPQSEAVGPYWRRHISVARFSSGRSAEHARVVWQHRCVRARQHALRRAGGDGVLDAIAQVSLGNRGFGQVRTLWEGVAGGGGCKNTATASAIAIPDKAALAANARLQISPAHGDGLPLQSTRPASPLPLWGALETGWNHGAGGTGVQSQSLRGFASAAPPDPSAKTSPDSKVERVGPGQRAFLGDLLKPSDVRVFQLCRPRSLRSYDLPFQQVHGASAQHEPQLPLLLCRDIQQVSTAVHGERRTLPHGRFGYLCKACTHRYHQTHNDVVELLM